MPVIGYFSARSPDAEAPVRVPFLKALEGSGFAVGRNVAIEYRFAEGQDEHLPMLAADLVRRQVAMLVATDRPSAVAARAATSTIPIVFAIGADPVKVGLVASSLPASEITLAVGTSPIKLFCDQDIREEAHACNVPAGPVHVI